MGGVEHSEELELGHRECPRADKVGVRGEEELSEWKEARDDGGTTEWSLSALLRALRASTSCGRCNFRSSRMVHVTCACQLDTADSIEALRRCCGLIMGRR